MKYQQHGTLPILGRGPRLRQIIQVRNTLICQLLTFQSHHCLCWCTYKFHELLIESFSFVGCGHTIFSQKLV